MNTLFVVLCICLELLGIIIFLHGFFPIKSVMKESASWKTLKLEPSQSPTGESLPPVFGRMVFVLIDALRADFVLAPSSSSSSPPLPRMAFVEEKLRQGEAQGFIARAQPPTVTMPRIKALMTGSIPGFVDVALNFAAAAAVEDSVVRQLQEAGRGVVFYGDDTWMRLFPGMFVRQEGTTSFFVTDYTEVDNNVTRHLSSELSERGDWDVLVLHYLGLDHIGHLAGPRSPLVKPKLDEMDAIVRTLYESISEQEKGGLPSVLVLCGDHGMSEQGSHGGATYAEVATPLVLISPLWKDSTDSPQQYEEVLQVDMAPSLTLLLGLPSPQNSLGVLLPGLMETKPWRHRLQAAYVNSQQMEALFQRNVGGAENEPESHQLERARSLHLSWLDLQYNNATSTHLVHLQAQKVEQQYRVAMTAMRNKMAASLASYDVHAMAVGCFVMWMVLIALLLLQYLPVRPSSTILSSPAACLSIFLLTLAFVALHMVACTSSHASTVLCSPWGFGATAIGSGVMAAMAVVLGREMVGVRGLKLHVIKHIPRSVFGRLVAVGTVGHALSLCASSFVEEEHQTCYFLSLTALLLIFVQLCYEYCYEASSGSWNDAQNSLNDDDDDETMAEFGTRMDSKGHETISTGVKFGAKTRHYRNKDNNDDNESSITQLNRKRNSRSKGVSVTLLPGEEEREGRRIGRTVRSIPEVAEEESGGRRRRAVTARDVWCAVGAMVLCRVLRAWNRTGDKWATLPDIGDWLVRPDNKVLLSALCGVSLLVIGLLQPSHTPRGTSRVFSLAAWGCLGAVYAFRATSGSFWWPGHTQPNKGIVEARIAYGCIGALLIYTIFNKTSAHSKVKKSPSQISDSHQAKTQPRKRQQVDGNSETKEYMELDRTTGEYTDTLDTAPDTAHDTALDTAPNTAPDTAQDTAPDTQDTAERLYYIWALLMTLLVRSHNIPVVAMELCLVACVQHLVEGCMSKESDAVLTLLYIWLGQAAFFHQGNSNSIASVDVSAGYIGLEEYQPVVIGLLMVLHTYSGPILWFSARNKLARPSSSRLNDASVPITYMLSRALPVAGYTVLVSAQRYHLFVWSVFSPKLLYEAMHTLVVSVLVMGAMVTGGRKKGERTKDM